MGLFGAIVAGALTLAWNIFQIVLAIGATIVIYQILIQTISILWETLHTPSHNYIKYKLKAIKFKRSQKEDK